jgi:hypothetical protein
VLLNDQLASQRNHEEHTEEPAQQCQQKNARVLEVEAKKNQGRQGKDHSRRDRLSRVSGCLHDVVFQDRGSPKRAQQADGKHGDGDRRSHC